MTLIADNMAASMMRRGLIDLVIVGADRIAANGDVANKIGTYGVAVLAQAHGLPFYVAAPMSTIDASLPSGDDIPIEERQSDEVTHFGGRQIAPTGVGVLNLAFDVTPHAYVHAIITELGVLRPPSSKASPRRSVAWRCRFSLTCRLREGIRETDSVPEDRSQWRQEGNLQETAKRS